MGPEPRKIARPHPIPQHTPMPRLPVPGRATHPTPGHLPRAQGRAPAPSPAGTGIAFPQLPGKLWPVRTVPPPPPPSPHLRQQARAPRPPRTPRGPPPLTPAPARPRPPAQSGPEDPHLGRRSKAPSSPSPSSPPYPCDQRRLPGVSGTLATSGAAPGARAEESRETAPPGLAGRSRLAAAAAGLALRPGPARAAPPGPGSGLAPLGRVERCRGSSVGPGSPLHFAVSYVPSRGVQPRIPNKASFRRTQFIPNFRSQEFLNGANLLWKVSCPSDLSWRVGSLLGICLKKTKQKTKKPLY